MKKIIYQIEKRKIELEVSDEFAVQYEKLEVETKREQWKLERADKRHVSSFDEMEEAGHQFIDENSSIEESLINKERKEKLYKALENLSKEQQQLIKDVYFVGKKQVDIAKEIGVDKRVIGKRLDRIYAHLKNILEKSDI